MIAAIIEAVLGLLLKWLRRPPAQGKIGATLEKGQDDEQAIRQSTQNDVDAVVRDDGSLRKQSDDVNAAIKRQL